MEVAFHTPFITDEVRSECEQTIVKNWQGQTDRQVKHYIPCPHEQG